MDRGRRGADLWRRDLRPDRSGRTQAACGGEGDGRASVRQRFQSGKHNAFNLENYIITQFGKALGNAEEDAFLNGDGTGKPLGIFAETGGGQTAVTLSGVKLGTDDILTLIYALKRPYRKNASFILNDQTLAAIRNQAGEPDRICGYEVHTSAYAPALEANKAVMAFGDFSYYNIGDRGTRSVQILRELFAGNGMIGYVAKERVDGKLVLPEAVQIMKAGASA